MDLQKTAREIGLFETAVNLAKFGDSEEVIREVGAYMPLPDKDITARVEMIAEWLLNFGKSQYMFLTPEIALIEEMGKRTKNNPEFIIAISNSLEEEAEKRLKNNFPQEFNVTTLEKLAFPQYFRPQNGMMVISGYLAGDRTMVMPDTYFMIEHYRDFLGKKAFVAFRELNSSTRYDGWMEVRQKRLSDIWRIKTDE